MSSPRHVVSAALVVTAFLLVPDSAKAGESPYNPNPKPATPQDYSYVCVAGNVGTFHTLYITAAHHADWPANDPTGIRKASMAWAQAIRGQPYPNNAHCLLDHTAHVQQLRQSLLAQPHEKTVNVDWQYGQAGPAAVSGSSFAAAPSSPAHSTPAAGLPPGVSSPVPGTAQGALDTSGAQLNEQLIQTQQNLLNRLRKP